MASRSGALAAALALTCLVTAGAYFWLVSYGTGDLARGEVRGVAYDSLAAHLPALDASVDSEAIGWEGFTVGNRTFIYFGPFPALLRIVPNWLFPSMYGRWSRLSCLLAAMLAVAAATLSFASALRSDARPLAGRRAVLLVAATLAVGLGSPLVYLVSCGRIYHEAILWALAGSLAGVLVLLRILLRKRAEVRDLVLLSTAFAIALLSRVTFGVPLAVAILVVAAIEAARLGRERPTGRARLAALALLALSLLPALVAGVFQLWYNHARFGSVWKSIDFQATYLDPDKLGGVFNLRRIPSALRSYLWFTARSFRTEPPFVQLAAVRYADDTLFFGWKEETLPLLLGSPWLLLGAALGLGVSARRRLGWLASASAIPFAFQCLLISSFYFVTERYAAEFLPLLLLLFALFLARTAASPPSRWLVGSLALLAVASIPVNLTTALQWNLELNGDAPGEYKFKLAALIYPDGGAPCPGHLEPLPLDRPLKQTNGFASPRVDQTWDGHPISLHRVFYRRGLGQHAPSSATFAVPRGASAFCAVVGVADSSLPCTRGSVVAEVADEAGHVLFRSDMLRAGQIPARVVVELGNAKEITLSIGDAGDGIDCDHGVWAAPSFATGANR